MRFVKSGKSIPVLIALCVLLGVLVLFFKHEAAAPEVNSQANTALNPVALRVNLLLPIQRQMIAVFAHQYLRQQSGRRQASIQ